MGKSSGLVKALLGGVKALRSSSKEKNKADQQNKSTAREKTKWGLGKSASRHWDAGTVKAEQAAGGATSAALQRRRIAGEHTHAESMTSDDNSESKILTKRFAIEVQEGPDTYYDDTYSVNTEEWVDYNFDRAAKPTVADLSVAAAAGEYAVHIDEEGDEENAFITKTFTWEDSPSQPLDKTCIVSHSPSKLHWAASVIQTAFRGYLARRALRALKGLVRLQALARGRMVRKQAAATLRCVHALVRVQARVRARRVRMSDEGQAVQRQLQRRKQAPLPSGEWDNSPATPEQMEAKAHYRQVAAMKRERALAYAFSEQLRRCAPKQDSIVIDCKGDKSEWGWRWLDRWMAARPWESSFPGLAREHVSVMNIMDPSLQQLVTDNSSSNNANASTPPFVRKRSLSCIPESMLNNLDSILSPSKTTPPPSLRTLSKRHSFGTHHLVGNSSSPSSQPAALTFDASQPLLSSPFRLRLSLPTLSSLTSQKTPTRGLPLPSNSNFINRGPTVDKDRIVAEALKGSLHVYKRSGLSERKDDSHIRCNTEEEKDLLGSDRVIFSKLGNKVQKKATNNKGGKIERDIESGNKGSNIIERRSSYERGTTEGAKKRDSSIKASECGDGLSHAVPGYMLSTQSTKAKARQASSTSSTTSSPAKKQDSSPASATKKHIISSPAVSAEPQLPLPAFHGVEQRTPSPALQRLLSNARSSSSRNLLSSFKEHIASDGAVTQGLK